MVAAKRDQMSSGSDAMDCILSDMQRQAVQKTISDANECIVENEKLTPVQCVAASAHKNLPKAGMKFPDNGSMRTVYRWDDCVIKIPVNRDGVWENLMEQGVRASVPNEISKYFNPIDEIGIGGSYITAPYAEPITDAIENEKIEPYKAYKSVMNMLKEIKDSGFTCMDAKMSNVGLRDGKPVIIDYALTEPVCQTFLPGD